MTWTNTLTMTEIAKLCHEVNRAYCASIGDMSQVPWEQTPDWQKENTCKGVRFHMGNETMPEQSHQSCMAQKVIEGWVYGPLEVPYDRLPPEQRSKNYIFKAICDFFKVNVQR